MKFDIQLAPPTIRQIEEARAAVRKRRTVALVLATPLLLWAALGGVASTPDKVALIAFVCFIGYPLYQRFLGLRRLASLSPDETPDQCIRINEWRVRDAVLEDYLNAVITQGRMPVFGEYEAAEEWMYAAPKRKKIDKARKACRQMANEG